MKSKIIILGVFCGLVLLPSALNAQVVFSDSSMASSAGYTVNASPISGSSLDYQANFGVSYTSALGVPQDPYNSSTTALQLKINETTGVQSGVSVSPTSLLLSGAFSMTFDMWLNYNSGGFTTGSTQVGSYGLTTAANQVQWAGIGNGQLFGEVTDNGSSTYYRGYNNSATIGATPFSNGSQSYATAPRPTQFPSVSVPATETALDANQSGSTVAGTVGFRWLQVNVTWSGGVLSESLNGNLIASYSVASVGPDIFLGMYDINNGSAGVSGLADQNYVLFDNVAVTQIPEPTSCLLGILGGAGLFLARRRTRNA